MSLRSANFAPLPVLTQDSQGPQTVASGSSPQSRPDPVHNPGNMGTNRRLNFQLRPGHPQGWFATRLQQGRYGDSTTTIKITQMARRRPVVLSRRGRFQVPAPLRPYLHDL